MTGFVYLLLSGQKKQMKASMIRTQLPFGRDCWEQYDLTLNQCMITYLMGLHRPKPDGDRFTG